MHAAALCESQEQAIADRWLEALTVCQVASGLLLRWGQRGSTAAGWGDARISPSSQGVGVGVACRQHMRPEELEETRLPMGTDTIPIPVCRELDEVEANLRYWRRQEQAGGHFWNALLRRVGAGRDRRLCCAETKRGLSGLHAMLLACAVLDVHLASCHRWKHTSAARCHHCKHVCAATRPCWPHAVLK